MHSDLRADQMDADARSELAPAGVYVLCRALVMFTTQNLIN